MILKIMMINEEEENDGIKYNNIKEENYF